MDYSFLLPSCTIHKSQHVAEKLLRLDGVNEATPVFGSFDCVVKTDKMTPDDVMQLVVSSIRPLDDDVSVLPLYSSPPLITNHNVQ
ncbi:MAG: hypothetical protein HKP31_07035 [Nitrosopumilus sp.]|nr:hypothetical protein [Nitrosopumilus sp.]